MLLKEIMNVKVEVIDPAATLDEAQSLMRQRRFHHLVVMDGREVVGVLTEQALERTMAGGGTRVDEALYRDVVTATPDWMGAFSVVKGALQKKRRHVAAW